MFLDRISNSTTRWWRSRLTTAALMICSVGVLACEDLLEISLPGEVDESDVRGPGMMRPLVLGAVADFECAFSEYVNSTSVWANVFQSATSWAEVNRWANRAAPWGTDQGTGQCPRTLFRGGFNVYLPLHIARNQADNAFRLLESFADPEVPGRRQLMATAAAYGGYSILHLAEFFCEVRLDSAGGRLKPAPTMEVADQRFQKAIELAQAVGDAQLVSLGRMGRARALNYIGRKTEAATIAAQIPKGFVHYATYSGSVDRRANGVYRDNNINHATTVDPRYRNVTVEGVADPRIRVVDAGRNGLDGSTRIWVQMRYGGLDASIPMASWQEAQLIIAEAEVEAGNAPAAVAAINRLRTERSLPLYRAEALSLIREQVIEERRRELFLQGHRVGDMIRFRIPFDKGLDHKGQAISDDMTCHPMPDTEL